MTFRTIRQTRYNRLEETGFLPFEARILSKIALKVPYIRLMIKERKDTLKDALREYKERGYRFSKAEWKEVIAEMYIARGWLKEGKPDVWQMVRANEERYRARHPEYESPPRARKVKIKRKDEFTSKYAKGLEAYEKGRYR